MQNYQKPPTNPIPGFVIRHCLPLRKETNSPFSIFYEVKADPYQRLHEAFVDAELIADFYSLELNANILAQLQQVQQRLELQLEIVQHYHVEGLEGNLLGTTELERLQAQLPIHFPEEEIHIQVINPTIPWDDQFDEGFFISGSVWNKGVSGYGVAIHEVLFEDQDVSAAFTRGSIANHLFSDSLVSAYEKNIEQMLTKDDIEMYKVALQESLIKEATTKSLKVA